MVEALEADRSDRGLDLPISCVTWTNDVTLPSLQFLSYDMGVIRVLDVCQSAASVNPWLNTGEVGSAVRCTWKSWVCLYLSAKLWPIQPIRFDF